MDSIILIENGKIYKKSNAIFKIVKHLNGFWKLIYVFVIVPKFIRDFIYTKIAKNRYQWFGKRNTCMVPTKELKNRFLD